VFGALLGAAATGALLAPAASAQRVVPVHEEPRHRLIQVVGHMTVLDVQIQPGDTTLFHTHRTPITYVTIGTSSTDSRSLGGEWAGTPPRSPPQVASRGMSMRGVSPSPRLRRGVLSVTGSRSP
jgi:hypothetical protein